MNNFVFLVTFGKLLEMSNQPAQVQKLLIKRPYGATICKNCTKYIKADIRQVKAFFSFPVLSIGEQEYNFKNVFEVISGANSRNRNDFHDRNDFHYLISLNGANKSPSLDRNDGVVLQGVSKGSLGADSKIGNDCRQGSIS